MDDTPKYRDEIDFRELRRSPGRLFGYSYVYILVTLVGLGVYYINRLNAVGSNAVAPVMARDSSVFVTDIPLQSPAVLPPVDIMAVSVPNDSLLRKGRELFKANCTSCHGDNGLGDGPAGLALNPKPRNFHSQNGWTNGPKLSQIYRTLEEGIVRNGMASYNYLPPADRVALAHVIRSFMSGPPMDSKEELMALETTYQLSKGTVRPGQIPIRRAAGLYVHEESAAISRASSEAAALAQSQEPGAKLLTAALLDPERGMRALASLRRSITGPDDLMRAVTGDPASMGFRPGVASLNAAEWASVFDYLTARGLAGRGI
jgi:mono/diheme cytochrome c family protein